MEATKLARRLPVGAEALPGGGVHFRVWAPRRRRVEVIFEGEGAPKPFALEEGEGGYFSGLAERVRAGALYRFRLDGDDYLYPDPASRFQPEGPHRASRGVDPRAFRWTDSDWRGAPLKREGVYQLHVGTFTRGGTLAAATAHLKELSELGVTCVE